MVEKLVRILSYHFIHAHACDANQGCEDVHVLQDYEYEDANAICGSERFLLHENGYDAHQYADDNGYVP